MSDETQETGVNSNEAADPTEADPVEQAAADAPEESPASQQFPEEDYPGPSAPTVDADIVELTQRLELAESQLAFQEAFLLTLPEYKHFITRHM